MKAVYSLGAMLKPQVTRAQVEPKQQEVLFVQVPMDAVYRLGATLEAAWNADVRDHRWQVHSNSVACPWSFSGAGARRTFTVAGALLRMWQH